MRRAIGLLVGFCTGFLLCVVVIGFALGAHLHRGVEAEEWPEVEGIEEVPREIGSEYGLAVGVLEAQGGPLFGSFSRCPLCKRPTGSGAEVGGGRARNIRYGAKVGEVWTSCPMP